MFVGVTEMGLHWIDVAVVVVYLFGITILGLWMGSRISELNDYFMPRKFGKGMMMMHAFGTGTASDQAVTVASATFRGGLSGIWYQWLWLFVTPFYWLIAPIFRRFRAITTADVYELRFDRSVAILFACVGMLIGPTQPRQGIGRHPVCFDTPVAKGDDGGAIGITCPCTHAILFGPVHPFLHRVAGDVPQTFK